MSLELAPISQRDALSFVAEHHRHNKPPAGSKFQVAAVCGDTVVGVAIAGRPVSRMLQAKGKLEVTRVCTDGYDNACSKLYGACRRAGTALGYRAQDIITYTLESESGASLRAAGWVVDEVLPQAKTGWTRPSRPRDAQELTDCIAKIRWRAAL